MAVMAIAKPATMTFVFIDFPRVQTLAFLSARMIRGLLIRCKWLDDSAGNFTLIGGIAGRYVGPLYGVGGALTRSGSAKGSRSRSAVRD